MPYPTYLELPPTYDADGYMKIALPGDPVKDLVMCSICRSLVNRYNQTDHTNDHLYRDDMERLLMELTRWKTSFIRCPECFVSHPMDDKEAHDLHHSYIEEQLEEAQTRTVDVRDPAPLTGVDVADLLDGLEKKPRVSKSRTCTSDEIKMTTTNSILGYSLTTITVPVDTDGDGIDDAVRSFSYDSSGTLVITE